MQVAQESHLEIHTSKYTNLGMKDFVRASYLLSDRSLQASVWIIGYLLNTFYRSRATFKNIIYSMYNLVSIPLSNSFFYVYDLEESSAYKLLKFKEVSHSFCHVMNSTKRVRQKAWAHESNPCSLTYLFSHRINLKGKTSISRSGAKGKW